jgi:AAA15 family ATPase/GTPase
LDPIFENPMLVSFSVSNFRSFKEEVHFSMEAKKAYTELPQNVLQEGKNRLLRSAVVYGANASGKSNLFQALNFVSKLIWSAPDYQRVGVWHESFRLSESADLQPTRFQYHFIREKTEFLYDLELEKDRVTNEVLRFKPKGQMALLYERKGSDVEFGPYFKNQDVIKNWVKRPENQQRLVLIIAGQLGINHVQQAYQEMETMFFWDQAHWDISNEQGESRFLELLHKNKTTPLFDVYQKLLKSLDVGIQDIEIEEHKNEATGQSQFRLTTFRQRNRKDGKVDKVPFGVFSESIGTQTMMTLALPILEALIRGFTIIIDEIDRSLHPDIVEYLIRLFHDPAINTRNAQLICTSHNVLLMKNDLLRRDQIWMVEKDETGASQLFSLGEVGGLKKEMPLSKFYLAGKLGGTPIINDLEFKKTLYGSQVPA